MVKILRIILKDQIIKCRFKDLEIINQQTDYDVKCKVSGGLTGQAGAMVHGISRAILKFDENLKASLKKKN